MNIIFSNRREAGALLARKVHSAKLARDPLVLALPRGGVPVGFEIAMELDAFLDVFTVRKLGVPGHEELAMGAIATGGIRVLNEDVIHGLDISPRMTESVAEREELELRRREQAYRHESGAPDVTDRFVILVDDGIATGSTMLAAIQAVKTGGAAHVLVATPVAPRSTVAKLRKAADQVVVLSTPEPFHGVGQWYNDFEQTTDDEVQEFLRIANERHATPA